MKCLFKTKAKSLGMYLPVILMACTLFMALAVAVITISMSNLRIANLHNNQISSMSSAEAGINYYMWHLSHENSDYCDGAATCPSLNADGSYGPFSHDYTGISGEILGSYDLYITPPSSGSSITTVKSVGKIVGSKIERTILSQIGMPSFAKYTLLINGNQLTLGSDGKIEGTVHVNNSGVYNLGEITGDASSTEDTYQHATYGTQPGVGGPGIFGGGKFFPVPAIDFNQLSVDILKLRNDAKNNGKGDYYDTSTSKGYHLILNQNNYELRRVTKYNSDNNIVQEDSSSIHNYPTSEGIIFLEDSIWVEGTIDNKKITIIAADPEASSGQLKRIIVNGSIKYTKYDGSDKIGLITQTDITLAKNVPTDTEIDAAMIAKAGDISIPNYGSAKNSLKIYGSMACETAIFKYSVGNTVVGGFNAREIKIDTNNVLSPPPKFPLTGTFAILSWREE